MEADSKNFKINLERNPAFLRIYKSFYSRAGAGKNRFSFQGIEAEIPESCFKILSEGGNQDQDDPDLHCPDLYSDPGYFHFQLVLSERKY
jgi:hypothetical protein